MVRTSEALKLAHQWSVSIGCCRYYDYYCVVIAVFASYLMGLGDCMPFPKTVLSLPVISVNANSNRRFALENRLDSKICHYPAFDVHGGMVV